MPSRFGLSLNASKTRLIEFGHFAAINRRDRGLGKPDTFDFLGFTHCCSTNRSGGFQLPRGAGEPDTSWRFSFGGMPSMAASSQATQPA